MSALMAAHAASLTAAGAGKSGNPCDRLTPPYRWLRRVISRMTDSVNCVAFFDPVSFDIVFLLMLRRFFSPPRCLFLHRRLLRGRLLRGRGARSLRAGRGELTRRRHGVIVGRR